MSGGCHSSGKVLPLRSNSYANAECWDDLVYVFIESLKNSSLDEMVLLLHTTIPGPYGRRSKYVRPVSYNRLDDIPRLLLSTRALSGLRNGVSLTRQQGPWVGVAVGAQPNSDRNGRDHEQENQETRVNAAKAIQDAYRRHLERKRVGAARKIQTAYRRYLERKKVVRTGIDAIQARYWHLLRKSSMEMKWPKNSQYYLLFRVPLADILVCLNVIKTFADSKKKEIKERLTTEDDRDLGEALHQNRYDKVDRTLSIA